MRWSPVIVLRTRADVEALYELINNGTAPDSTSVVGCVHRRLSSIHYRLGIKCTSIAGVGFCYLTKNLDFVEDLDTLQDIIHLLRVEIDEIESDPRLVDAYKYLVEKKTDYPWSELQQT